MKRPEFKDIKSGKEFNNWYWLKAEMVDICKQTGLSYTGSKFEIRDRIIYALDHNGTELKIKKSSKKSTFNWAKAILTLDTPITDNITFGPNVRGFLTQQIGHHFVCNMDFMKWVKSNIGKTLQEAITAWYELETRKNDPTYQSTIAKHNMFNQYIRDYLQANVGHTFQQATDAWKWKKQQPTTNGFVIYETVDVKP